MTKGGARAVDCRATRELPPFRIFVSKFRLNSVTVENITPLVVTFRTTLSVCVIIQCHYIRDIVYNKKKIIKPREPDDEQTQLSQSHRTQVTL